MIYTNAQNLLAHKEEIQHLIMMKINPVIMALTESRIEEIDDSKVSMPDYNMVRCDSDSRFTAGVAIYVRNDIRFETILTRQIELNCWTTAIEVKEK